MIEFLLLSIVACCAAKIVHSVTRKRAARRSIEAAESASTKFPCRISWKPEIGKEGFVYGKIIAGTDGDLMFSRRKGRLVNLPHSEWVHREASWRPGLSILRYTVPGKGDVRILLSEVDVDTIEDLLRSAGKR